ncbi:iron ABC transporter permease [Paenalkalicoccus suaedae]|uniref:Iron ABC transporter permease n=1 Tax=Paenalkalicoccus suaedae TaxID=2592382 RepID=A0A859FEE6_9BACI|nr:iron ABC transporter permease [Paenalkalicoccus suaedae]QKS70605.1 iron ABC transporter permease [Paenalkalicoccus suaedae]
MKIGDVASLILALLFLLVTFAASILFGAAQTTWQDAWSALTSPTVTDQALIIREIRLPREIGAVFVGAALAVAGAVMQGITRNPLADPGLLGITAGANVALAFSLAFIPSVGYVGYMFSGWIGAAFGAFLVIGIASTRKGGFKPFRLVLAGAAVTALLVAIAEAIGLVFQITREVSAWTAGGLIGTTWTQLYIIVPTIIVSLIIVLMLARQVTLLSLDEDVATGLGASVTKVKLWLFFFVIILAGSSVALVGNIAFVGLMIPHIVRKLVGTDYRMIIPMSALVGGAFMVGADTLARVMFAPIETPVVAIISVCGLPFFLWVVKTQGREFA